jgi:hypothetical protein
MQLQADLRPITIPEKGRFRPVGRHTVHGPKEHFLSARKQRTGNRLLSARFLVGFNVHGHPHFTEEDLIKFFVEIRSKQNRSAGASFLTQRGIWQPLGGRREPDEQGAQILVLNEDQLDQETFIDEMSALGEELCRKMDQDAIYLDIQKSGVVVESLELTQD